MVWEIKLFVVISEILLYDLKEYEERVKLEKQIEYYQWLLSVNGIIVEEDDLK